MSDRLCVVLAVGVAAAALVAMTVPWWWLALAAGAAVALRSSALGVAAAVMLAGNLSASAWAGLDAPLPDRRDGVVRLTTDPRYVRGGGMEVEVEAADRLLMASVPPESVHRIKGASAGDRFLVEGRIRPLSGKRTASLRRKHVAGRLMVEVAGERSPATGLDGVANRVRSNLTSGAAALPAENRSLLLGFVLGDDRGQSSELRAAFEESGLLHLLAVSGSNVAFVLIVFLPLLQRFGLKGRYIGGLAVLVVFGTVTRWEPSVLRAEVMAAVVLTAIYLGRPVSRTRVLSLAIALSVLGDPFLVGSIGFLLSVTACIGMAVAGEWISERAWGPMWLRRSIGYSVAAQIGVAPVHCVVFGPMPLAALPANVLAEPVAGMVMVWGVVAGSAAGLVGEPLATVLHWPTWALTEWVASVARVCAGLSLGDWSWWSAIGAFFVLALRRRRSQAVEAVP